MSIFKCGDRFASYQIGELVGIGSRSEVYEAFAPDGARAALKVLKERSCEDERKRAELEARLAQEGEAIARIDHVHVVGYIASGIEGGRVYVVMELVDGLDLRRLLQANGGILPVEDAVAIMRQACEGVAAGHDEGIVHRDLKPENLLVTWDGLVKVGDYGSAKLWPIGLETTNEHDIRSSLYASPECGVGRKADPSTDVYAMGIILYEILVGAHPIAPVRATAYEIVKRHLHFHPPPLSTFTELSIPGDLSALVERALCKTYSRRCTMRELGSGLAGVLRRLRARRRAEAGGLQIPGRALVLARTEPALKAFGPGGTIPMPAVVDPPAASHASSRAPDPERAPGDAPSSAIPWILPSSPASSTRDATPPPAPSGAVPAPGPVGGTAPATTIARDPASPTLRSPVTVALGEVDTPAERRSTGAPVERPARPSAGPSARVRVIAAAGIVVLVVGLSGAWWVLGGRAPVSATTSPAASAASLAGLPDASTSAAPPAVPVVTGAPRSKTPAPAASGRRRTAPQRQRLPFPFP